MLTIHLIIQLLNNYLLELALECKLWIGISKRFTTGTWILILPHTIFAIIISKCISYYQLTRNRSFLNDSWILRWLMCLFRWINPQGRPFVFNCDPTSLHNKNTRNCSVAFCMIVPNLCKLYLVCLYHTLIWYTI